MLKERGVEARHPRLAAAQNHALCIGHRSTILRSPGEQAYGVVYALTHHEIHKLYGGIGLDMYGPEAVMAKLLDGPTIPAVSWILLEPPAPNERNPDCAQKLSRIMAGLGLPAIDFTQASPTVRFG